MSETRTREDENLVADENWKEFEFLSGEVPTMAKNNSRRQLHRLPVSAEGFGIVGSITGLQSRVPLTRGPGLYSCLWMPLERYARLKGIIALFSKVCARYIGVELVVINLKNVHDPAPE